MEARLEYQKAAMPWPLPVLPPPHSLPPPLCVAGVSGPRLCVWQGLAWEVLLRLECNVFSYWGQGYGEQHGMGVFVHAAMFNHSCRPNTAKVRRGGEQAQGRRGRGKGEALQGGLSILLRKTRYDNVLLFTQEDVI